MRFTQRNDASLKRQDPDPPGSSPIMNNQTKKENKQKKKPITDTLLDGKHFLRKKALDVGTLVTTVLGTQSSW